MPELMISISRPKRWDEPFGSAMTPADVARLLQIEPFCGMNPGEFLPQIPLAGLLLNDTRIVRYKAGDIIVREGDYGNSAFMILGGQVRVALESLRGELLGRTTLPRGGWLNAIAQLWKPQTPPEARPRLPSGSSGAAPIARRQVDDQTHVFLQDVPRVLDETRTAILGAGEFFGELAAMSRTPRTATAFADGDAELLEIRWQGLRDLMRRAPALRKHLERLYRENSLEAHLRETPLLKSLPAADLEHVVAATVFESYGNFDWNTQFEKTRLLDPLEQIAREPIVAEEGQAPTGLLLIRSGFGRVCQRHGAGHRTVAYLGKGHVFGAEELSATARSGEPVHWHYSLRALGYLDVLRIPVEVFCKWIAPHLSQEMIADETDTQHPEPWHAGKPAATALHERTLDFLTDHRFINGTQTMLIDLDRCTRCDDCVQACAATHDGNPRFIRQGPVHDRFMVAHACMHCVDPVCMIGCPTGAIHRDPTTGILRINDQTCIGCATCAKSCPYQNIQMVEIRDQSGAFIFDEQTQQPILKATKCDLCADQPTGPACQRACPHEALVRIDMLAVDGVKQWLGR
ncbi:MAG: cyclic nucleotide-binding domain-containing protein [Pirellulales bacterium]